MLSPILTIQGGETMQILEHQSLLINNVISYHTHLSLDKLPSMVEYVRSNVCNLGAELSGSIMYTENSDNYKNIELIIPVNVQLKNCEEYEYKPVFKLLNAVSVRHEGLFSNIEKTENRLIEYIKDKSYSMLTQPYYNIIRLEPDDTNNCIVDIYIGTEYNAS